MKRILWLAMPLCGLLLFCACMKTPASIPTVDPAPNTFTLSLVMGTEKHAPRIQSVWELQCTVNGISDAVKKGIDRSLILPPKRLSATAGAYLLRNFSSDYSELILRYHETDNGVYAVASALDMMDTTRGYRCVMDAASGSKGVLEIVNRRTFAERAGAVPIDPHDKVYSQFCTEVMECCLAKLDIPMDRLSELQAGGNMYISEIRALDHEEYDYMLYCRIHDTDKGNFLIAMPTPIIDGEIYYIKHFRDNRAACESSPIDVFHFDA